ncbi:aminotransferase class I/II-fold pyridoxal phosphate-dependent enzyme [Cupriavidus consociatus]|uniref:aminotransferase class I/II-fold pyridoxal phosphate-dependent enzyme n=1 Tax=Cupriavidus consociatus TaxID=2821357 RepID=UPI001AE5F9BC|nr:MULTISPECIES: aminotransferase class I/II-fold pyridoxal phosphate-dependent enzyme [unclassified Cupriavidus]MBP0623109.1 aminotransferase class I/II-fold pyridoxal phosphate-dependent enzyme [Cupriavidus sp. LEh25]MDK2659800.1 aminotransferase class I/II-fold pyridoxal phosphate-dependent enzyme [Cupriavidus sp. LEh21]
MFDPSRFAVGGRKAEDLFRTIERAVYDNKLAAGEQLPTVRALAESLGINKNTVATAYRMLIESGVIVTAGRRGTVVAKRHLNASVPIAPPSITVSGVVAAHDGNPDPTFLPTRDEILDAFATTPSSPRLYGERRNVAELVDWATSFFESDFSTVHGIFVSSGALDAMERALRTHVKPGDKIAVETPTYMTTLALVRSLGLRAVQMEMDDEGIRPEALRNALSSDCRAVIFSSRAQNPTGAATGSRRARELRTIARGRDEVLFIDDDHSSLLDLAPYEPWHVESARWLTVRSLSKFLGPDLRVSVTCGDPVTLAKLEYSQATSMGWVSSLLQQTALALLNDRRVQDRIRLAGQTYRERFITLKEGLLSIGVDVPGKVGLNVWIPVKDEPMVVQWLLAKGWMVRSGSDFVVEGQSGIRVTSARLTTKEIEAFLSDFRELAIASSTTFSA